ncbi:uncharacterized protein LOC121714348 [Alosa sapidissima]|uniref:uncharacterized protein LOC121714348 n=1 Tax=Alosa sapidissima TaxID=34773 RepID=UPI001C089E54|nr:uncharacterized protein LOC121714348 [Alosa sapidissima]XP_041955577.1 uncharacterized protein LOC121714348 [Alosa sapidissima]XP_041955578.1 uncharacterized protein LOC121714348 [Alosa sapidissima]XP_041955580.1 uncharacterized protein LOC121714348 [Alosa sapidissima]XP_041955581.1 uncharacterized protein LOC121714348 [Alosa sapidissima]XP_041955582.1 uncharacterized protein LOC121714348 [Alosa sapidissima]XP_041955583.1 uncharacterized protein LOC121714348 [Alosa sapidissima]XP_04195558
MARVISSERRRAEQYCLHVLALKQVVEDFDRAFGFHPSMHDYEHSYASADASLQGCEEVFHISERDVCVKAHSGQYDVVRCGTKKACLTSVAMWAHCLSTGAWLSPPFPRGTTPSPIFPCFYGTGHAQSPSHMRGVINPELMASIQEASQSRATNLAPRGRSTDVQGDDEMEAIKTLDADTITYHVLKVVISSLAKKKKNFWTVENQPDWWPESLPFASPSHKFTVKGVERKPLPERAKGDPEGLPGPP